MGGEWGWPTGGVAGGRRDGPADKTMGVKEEGEKKKAP